MLYTLNLWTDSGDEELDITHEYTPEEVVEAIDDWCRDGDWGDDGDDLEVEVSWTITNEDGNFINSGTHLAQISHDPKTKIRAVGGDPNCDHDWERDESVGCRENPGVMGLGGTAISVTEICEHCGIVRNTRHNGSQRNPGQPRTQVSYAKKGE